jgi:hypothetical protein
MRGLEDCFLKELSINSSVKLCIRSVLTSSAELDCPATDSLRLCLTAISPALPTSPLPDEKQVTWLELTAIAVQNSRRKRHTELREYPTAQFAKGF